MNIRIVAVGKLKQYFADAVAEYAKRIKRFATFEIIEIAESKASGVVSQATIDSLLDKEAFNIIDKLKGYVIVLDVAGNMTSSTQLAQIIDKQKNSNSTFTFVIGSSYGLSDKVRANANYIMSFGAITLPHQLARVVLAEQIYRVMTIHNNITYHK